MTTSEYLKIVFKVFKFLFFLDFYGAPFGKKLITFLCLKHFFGAASSCFCRHQLTFCATSNFLFRHKIAFRATPNFFFWKSFRMLCHGNIFLLPSSNKNTILCRKKKNSFFCDSKNLISFFVPHKFFIFNFYIAHADLLRSGSRKKKLLIHCLLT